MGHTNSDEYESIGRYMIAIYFIFFLIGIGCGFPTFKYIRERTYLGLLFLIIPYFILGFLSFPNLYPNLEIPRSIYASWIIGVLIIWAIKDSNHKKNAKSTD